MSWLVLVVAVIVGIVMGKAAQKAIRDRQHGESGAKP